MIIKTSLSPEQARAITAVAKTARMTETEALVTCAFTAINTGYDSASEFRSHLLDVAGEIRDGRAGVFEGERRLPCGIILA